MLVLLIIEKVHLNSLSPDEISAFLQEQLSLRSKEESLYKKWFNTYVSDKSIIDWVDNTLTEIWGAHLAARVYHIIMTGYDGVVKKKFQKVKTHELEIESQKIVPGFNEQIENVFHISQVLSWLAGHRNTVQDQLEKIIEIPNLINELLEISK